MLTVAMGNNIGKVIILGAGKFLYIKNFPKIFQSAQRVQRTDGTDALATFTAVFLDFLINARMQISVGIGKIGQFSQLLNAGGLPAGRVKNCIVCLESA